MAKFIWQAITFILLLVLAPVIWGNVSAASLKFDKTSVTVAPDGTFTLEVKVDPGTEKIRSVDAYVLFDDTLLEAVSVADGNYFPTVTQNISPAKVYIAGLVDDPATFKTGVGTVATITFKALKNGTGTITYDCQDGSTTESNVIKFETNSPDIIECAKNDEAQITIGGTTSEPTATPAPETTSTPSSGDGGSSGDGSGTGGEGTPEQLPESGVFDNILSYSTIGAILLVFGVVVRFIL